MNPPVYEESDSILCLITNLTDISSNVERLYIIAAADQSSTASHTLSSSAIHQTLLCSQVTMPQLTLHLLSLTSHPSLEPLLDHLPTLTNPPLIVASSLIWAVRPDHIDASLLLTQSPQWDIALVFVSNSTLPATLEALVRTQWSVTFEISSEMLSAFPTTNQRLLHLSPDQIPALQLDSPSSSIPTAAMIDDKVEEGHLQVLPSTRAWMREHYTSSPFGRKAITMLNLLAFEPEGGREKFMGYAEAFNEGPGGKAGSEIKLMGTVVKTSKGGGKDEWDMVAFVHYPSVGHFVEMVDTEEYNAVDAEHRVGSLRDSAILCLKDLEV